MKEQEPKEEELSPNVLKTIYLMWVDLMVKLPKNKTFLEEMHKKQEKGGKCPPLP